MNGPVDARKRPQDRSLFWGHMSDFWDKSQFINSFVNEFPGWSNDPVVVSTQTPGVFYAKAAPQPVKDPKILTWSDDVASLLNLPDLATIQRDVHLNAKVAGIFAGNEVVAGMEPVATRYGGHQFGSWAGQLGDGRAILLGERKNDRGESWEIQLKGAGRTAYSRHADGRAVLRSSLREYLCSEAMFYLGIPTTRALCCVTTGDDVVRDMFYDGNPEAEPGAITTRVARSFLRFGHFEILAGSREPENLKKLVQYAIATFYPQFLAKDAKLTDEIIVQWFDEVIRRTALLVVDWLRVGFVHGVLNTDNMSILGLTIDYGPYGWLDSYDLAWTPNTTDFERRRYRFEQQPSIGLWNLTRLAEALSTIAEDSAALEKSLESYATTFQRAYRQMRFHKIGLLNPGEDDGGLIDLLDKALVSTEIDMTIFYRILPEILIAAENVVTDEEQFLELLKDALYQERPALEARQMLYHWVHKYRERMKQDSLPDAIATMNQMNPVFVPRNYQVQEVLDDLEKGDRGLLDQMLAALKQPYERNNLTETWFRKRPEWARRRPGCSALSCSS